MAREILFTPTLSLNYLDLQYVSMLELVKTFERMREVLQVVVPLRGSVNLAITDLKGGMFILMVHLAKDTDPQGQKWIDLSIWDISGAYRITNRGFRLEPDGCLAYTDARFLQEKMLRFTEGDFICDQCGKDTKRFSKGCGTIHINHYCPTCAKSQEFKSLDERTRGNNE